MASISPSSRRASRARNSRVSVADCSRTARFSFRNKAMSSSATLRAAMTGELCPYASVNAVVSVRCPSAESLISLSTAPSVTLLLSSLTALRMDSAARSG